MLDDARGRIESREPAPGSAGAHSYAATGTTSRAASGDHLHAAGSTFVACDIERILDMLPGLGTVLWLSRATRARHLPRIRIGTERPLLFGDAALAPLVDCRAVSVCAALTSHDGSREWLQFADAHGEVRAKLFLLPDTDYWAWDAMLPAGDSGPPPHGPSLRQEPCACARASWSSLRARHWQARVAQVQVMDFIAVRVVGLRGAPRLSALSHSIASSIVADERALWSDA